MSSAPGVETERPLRMRVSPDARCPHLVFERVFGPERVAALLDYVEARREDFRPAKIRRRASGEGTVDTQRRNPQIRRPRRIRRHAGGFVRSIAARMLMRALPSRPSAARVRSHRVSRRRLFSRAHRHDWFTDMVRVVLRLLFRSHAARFRRRLTAALRFSTTPLDCRPEATPYVDVRLSPIRWSRSILAARGIAGPRSSSVARQPFRDQLLASPRAAVAGTRHERQAQAESLRRSRFATRRASRSELRVGGHA